MSSLVDPSQYKPLMFLHENWRVIREECAALDRNDISDIERSGKSHEAVTRDYVSRGRTQWVRSWGEHKDKWLNWGLIVHDEIVLGDAGAPKTTNLLRHIRGIKVAALSLFKPGVLLPIHTHPELGVERLLSFHLCLEAPNEGCYLNADGEFAREEAGAAIVFDGSRPHYAFNASDVDRLLLYCEFSPEGLRWA